MKITPVTGPNLGTISTGTISPDRKEAARRAFDGVTMSPSDTPVATEIEAQRQNIRRIQMRTNASPDRIEEEILEPQSTISDNNQQTQTTEVTKPLSPQFAALAKQRRALQVKEAQLLAKEKALAEGPKGIDIARLKSEPLSVLQEAGVTYDQLTEAILANPGNSELLALRAKVEALEKGLDTKLNERDSQAEQQVLKELRRTVDKLAFSGDDFENIREERAQGKVVELIHRTWKQTGEVMDETEAAKEVENFLVEENEKRARRKSIMSRLTPQQAAQMVQSVPRQQMKTLTNRDTASPIISKRARAIAAMEGRLKR